MYKNMSSSHLNFSEFLFHITLILIYIYIQFCTFMSYHKTKKDLKDILQKVFNEVQEFPEKATSKKVERYRHHTRKYL